MEANPDAVSRDLTQALDEVSALRQFVGAPKEFWPRFLAAAGKLASADSMIVLLGQSGRTPRWSKLAEWNAGGGPSRLRTALLSQLEPMAERCLRESRFVEQSDASA